MVGGWGALWGGGGGRRVGGVGEWREAGRRVMM